MQLLKEMLTFCFQFDNWKKLAASAGLQNLQARIFDMRDFNFQGQ